MAEKQSFEVPNSKKPGQTAIYRAFPELKATFSPDVQSLYDIFRVGHKISKDEPCLGTRPLVNGQRANDYVWQTYDEILQRLTNFGSGLVDLTQGLGCDALSKKIPIGVWSINRAEWHIAEWACAAYGLLIVALYDTLGPDTVEYVMNHAEIETVLCTKEHIVDLLKLRSKLPMLKAIISMDEFKSPEDDAIRAWAQEKGLTIVTFADVERVGQQKPLSHRPPGRDDLACIMYTSGTTGQPKGVLLTHGNFVAAVGGVYPQTDFNATDVGISYLPLAHIYGRVVDAICISVGGRLGFISGTIDVLLDDMQVLKPTLFNAVPRLLNVIYSKIAQGTVDAPGTKGVVFRKAVQIKKDNFAQGKGVQHQILDYVLFDKVRQVLGGRLRFVVSGAGPLGREPMEFLRVVLSCDFREGFGATETCSSSSIQNMNDPKSGNIGVPMICNEIKLIDVPEMNYLSTDKPFPRGELCVRGYNVAKGYYKDEEKTREAFDEEGFFHTGDIVIIDERNTICIIDRKKNIFKLAQGEYVAPEKIENVHMKDPLVAQIFIHGDSLQSALIGVVVPDPEVLKQLVQEELPALAPKSYEEQCREPDVKDAVLKRMVAVGKDAKLRGFEFVKDIHLESTPFSIESGLMTPTFKLKRPEARMFYKDKIEELYHELNSRPSAARL